MRLPAGGMVVACLLGATSLLPACGIGTNGLGPMQDAAVPVDAEDIDAEASAAEAYVDVGTVDVAVEAPPAIPSCGSCGGACCGDQCVVRYCPDCDAGGLLCPFVLSSQSSNGYCIATCAACSPGGTPAPVTCYTCGDGIVLGSCAASASECPQTQAAGACTCPSGNAGECPGLGQVCTAVDGGTPVCVTM